MRDLTKAAFSLSWALPLYGAQQLLRTFSPSEQDRERATASYDAVTGAAAEALGSEGTLRQIYQIGQCAQNALLTMGPSFITPQLLDPRVWMDVTGEVAQRSADAVRGVSRGAGRSMWQELQDKGTVFCLVLDVSKLIHVPSEPPFPLYELLARSYALGLFPSLWAVEGLGHEYGDSFWKQGIRTPRGILNDERTKDLPPESLTMLHAGIGLSFAKNYMDNLGANPSDAQVRQMVEIVFQLCRDNSRPGYVGAAYESLGLVARTFHPELVGPVDRAVRAVAPDLLGFYWHGAGRAVFFAAINFLPGSDRFVFQMARDQAPDDEARRSSIAGAAWAYTVVAQRDPRTLATLVIETLGEELARDGAFSNGVASATMMRKDTTPNAPFIESFLRYQPSDPRVADLWQRLVRTPAETALNVWYPALKKADRLGEIFRYHDLPTFVAGIQGGAPR